MISTALLLCALLLAAPASWQEDATGDVDKVVAECVEKMNHEDWEVRGQGERALGELGEKAIAPLEKLLEAKGDGLARKSDIVEALHDIQIKVAEKHIRKLFPKDGTNPGTFDDQMKPVLEALGDRAEPYLLLVLKDVTRETSVRTLAATGLADLGRPSVVPELEERWKDEWETTDVRRAVAQSLDRLGKTEAMDSLIAKAEESLERSDKNPQMALRALFDLANLHRSRKAYEKTAGYFEKAGKLAPTNPNVDYNLACTYAVWGKKDEALTTLEAAVEKGYKDAAWMVIDGDLKSLREDERFVALVKKLEGGS